MFKIDENNNNTISNSLLNKFPVIKTNYNISKSINYTAAHIKNYVFCTLFPMKVTDITPNQLHDFKMYFARHIESDVEQLTKREPELLEYIKEHSHFYNDKIEFSDMCKELNDSGRICHIKLGWAFRRQIELKKGK